MNTCQYSSVFLSGAFHRGMKTARQTCARFLHYGLPIALMVGLSSVQATEIEPRAFSNAPVGLNFLIAGYLYTDGSVSFDPAVPLTDAQIRTDSAILGYARALDVGGRSAKFDMIVPYTSLEGSALYAGEPRTRDVSGLADPRFRFSVNFIGAPALSAQQFKDYRQDLIVGASLQVMPPWGQYDSSRLVNIGTNRWAFKIELGVSKARGPWTLEITPGVTLYTDNTDFLNGGTSSRTRCTRFRRTWCGVSARASGWRSTPSTMQADAPP
jgi:hypothetical protein